MGMSVEISSVIITAISFLAFMAALHFALFKPVLSLIHQRREKIEKGKRARDTSAEKLEAQNLSITQSFDAALKNQREASVKRVKEAKEQAAEMKKRFLAEENQRLEEIKQVLAREKEEMEKEFALYLSEFAKTLANRLVSKDY